MIEYPSIISNMWMCKIQQYLDRLRQNFGEEGVKKYG